MSDFDHGWHVNESVVGWRVRFDGPSEMSFQPNQYGKLMGASHKTGHQPPVTFQELNKIAATVHARLLGKRFGTAFSNERRNVCCEYAAALNKQMEARS